MPKRDWGLLVVVVSMAVFGFLAWQVRLDDSAVWRTDREVAADMKEHASNQPGLLQFFRIITHAGGIPLMTAVAIFGAVVLWLCGHRRLAVAWLLAAGLGCVVNFTAKKLIGRPRPGEELRDTAVSERNESFPSGHSMGSAIGYGSAAFVGVALLRRRWARVVVCLGLAMLVLVIGASRVYLRTHWCSDVVGGFAIGIGWTVLCFTVVDRHRVRA